MKHTEHYMMYAEVFELDVPLTQLQPTESTKEHIGHLASLAPVPTVDKADETILQDTLQVSLAEHKSQEEQEVRENVKLVNKHLASEEIEKMVEGSENVIDDSLPTRNDEPQIPNTRADSERQKLNKEMEWMIAKAILQERRNIQAEISLQIQKVINHHIPSQVDASMMMKYRRSKLSTVDIMKEVSLTIDEAKLKKMSDEMSRQRCTSGDEHQYHIDQMKNFLKSDIVWERRKEIIVSPHP
ncbi:hypothetical protein Tco_0468427 [Tanacetum coccineum]